MAAGPMTCPRCGSTLERMQAVTKRSRSIGYGSRVAQVHQSVRDERVVCTNVDCAYARPLKHWE
jgi:hypothetical protein